MELAPIEGAPKAPGPSPVYSVEPTGDTALKSSDKAVTAVGGEGSRQVVVKQEVGLCTKIALIGWATGMEDSGNVNSHCRCRIPVLCLGRSGRRQVDEKDFQIRRNDDCCPKIGLGSPRTERSSRFQNLPYHWKPVRFGERKSKFPRCSGNTTTNNSHNERNENFGVFKIPSFLFAGLV